MVHKQDFSVTRHAVPTTALPVRESGTASPASPLGKHCTLGSYLKAIGQELGGMEVAIQRDSTSAMPLNLD